MHSGRQVRTSLLHMSSWREFPWQPEAPDARSDRLCATGRRRDQPECAIEGADFRSGPAALEDELVIWAYNIERGMRIDDQLRAISGDSGMPDPDVLLISEADRGCTRTDGRNIAREYARALGMCYVYGAEFIELPRFWGPGGRISGRCEHGNAIISRYPIGNVRLIRHHRSRSWNSRVQRLARVGQPRLGGRVAVAADLRIGERLLRTYAVHFESGHVRVGPTNRDDYRSAQARELIADASGLQRGVVIGGDMNVVRHLATDAGEEPTTTVLFEAGFEDGHASLPRDERTTTDSGLTIDLIVGRGLRFTGAGVGARSIWGDLSDHLPIWASIAW